jgi:2-desacetyl-2-hydroxyethyl bacteriochlorophyllide A dehydrogenase
MKAAVFHGPRDIRVEEIAVPSLESGEILIQVRACGICGSDLHTYQHGMFESLGSPVEAGCILGHELSGEVVDIRGEVPGIRSGDRVCSVGTGGNAEYLRVPAALMPFVLRVPEGLSFEEAATVEPLATSLHAVRLANPVDGETHVVMGAGIIGLGVLQVLKATARVKTIVVDLSEKRLEMALAFGADTVVNAAKEDALEEVMELTGRREIALMPVPTGMADVVYDCAGLPRGYTGTPVVQQAISMVRQRGKVVVVAIFEKPAEVDCNVLVRKGVALFGSWAWTPEDLRHSMEILASGRIDRKPLITHRFPLDQAKEAYETQLRAHEAVKVMISP